MRPRFTENKTTQDEVPMDVLFDTFDIPTLTLEMVVLRQSSKRKRKQVEPLSPDLKRKKYSFLRKIISRGKYCREEMIFYIRLDYSISI